MIYHIGAFTAKRGKEREARQLLLDLAAYSKEHYGRKDITVLTSISGSAGRMYWMGGHESLSGYEEVMAKAASDPNPQIHELASKVSEFFEEGPENSFVRVES